MIFEKEGSSFVLKKSSNLLLPVLWFLSKKKEEGEYQFLFIILLQDSYPNSHSPLPFCVIPKQMFLMIMMYLLLLQDVSRYSLKKTEDASDNSFLLTACLISFSSLLMFSSSSFFCASDACVSVPVVITSDPHLQCSTLKLDVLFCCCCCLYEISSRFRLGRSVLPISSPSHHIPSCHYDSLLLMVLKYKHSLSHPIKFPHGPLIIMVASSSSTEINLPLFPSP